MMSLRFILLAWKRSNARVQAVIHFNPMSYI